MWFLGVSIACPDYKRPSVDTNVYFFEDEYQALVKLKKCKIKFIKDYDTSGDPRIKSLDENSPDHLLEELFIAVSDIDDFYSDSYMDNPPFYSVISEISIGDEISL